MKKDKFYCLFLIGLIACNSTPEGEKDSSSEKEGATSLADVMGASKDEAEMTYSYGIDISSFQGDEISELTPSDSLSYIICRATDGVTFVDKDFASNWSELAKKGFIKGAYHFYESNDDAQKQGEHYIQTVGDLAETDFPPLIDVENAGIHSGATAEGVAENLLALLNMLEEHYGRKPIVYTNGDIGNNYLTDKRFADYPLWIADYSGASEPVLPGAWKGENWRLWQRKDDYQLSKYKNDLDVFNGDLDALKKFLKQ